MYFVLHSFVKSITMRCFITNIMVFTTRHYVSTVYAAIMSIHHTPVLYQNGQILTSHKECHTVACNSFCDTKDLCEIPTGSPFDFQSISCYISKKTQDMDIITMER